MIWVIESVGWRFFLKSWMVYFRRERRPLKKNLAETHQVVADLLRPVRPETRRCDVVQIITIRAKTVSEHTQRHPRMHRRKEYSSSVHIAQLTYTWCHHGYHGNVSNDHGKA